MKIGNLILIVVMIGVFYALLILPQRRQQKNKANMMQKLGPGAKILTAGGIYGQVVSVHDDLLVVKVAQDVELEMDNRAVVRVVEAAPSPEVAEAE